MVKFSCMTCPYNINAHNHAYMRAHTQAHTHTHMPTVCRVISTTRQILRRTYLLQKLTYTHIHTHTYTHATYIHTHIHTRNIHTHTYTHATISLPLLPKILSLTHTRTHTCQKSTNQPLRTLMHVHVISQSALQSARAAQSCATPRRRRPSLRPLPPQALAAYRPPLLSTQNCIHYTAPLLRVAGMRTLLGLRMCACMCELVCVYMH
jgi:hypothetical protein